MASTYSESELRKLTVVNLKDLLKQAGAKSSGPKEELIQRAMGLSTAVPSAMASPPPISRVPTAMASPPPISRGAAASTYAESDLRKLTVANLKDLLKQAGAKSSGPKEELVQRAMGLSTAAPSAMVSPPSISRGAMALPPVSRGAMAPSPSFSRGGMAPLPLSRGGMALPPLSRGGMALPPLSRGGMALPPLSRGGMALPPLSRGGMAPPPLSRGGMIPSRVPSAIPPLPISQPPSPMAASSFGTLVGAPLARAVTKARSDWETQIEARNKARRAGRDFYIKSIIHEDSDAYDQTQKIAKAQPLYLSELSWSIAEPLAAARIIDENQDLVAMTAGDIAAMNVPITPLSNTAYIGGLLGVEPNTDPEDLVTIEVESGSARPLTWWNLLQALDAYFRHYETITKGENLSKAESEEIEFPFGDHHYFEGIQYRGTYKKKPLFSINLGS